MGKENALGNTVEATPSYLYILFRSKISFLESENKNKIKMKPKMSTMVVNEKLPIQENAYSSVSTPKDAS
jgi:predicted transport protein